MDTEGKQPEQDASPLTDEEEKVRKKEERLKRRRFKDNEEGREYECLLCDCKFFTVSQYNVHIQTYEHRKRKVGKISGGAGSSSGDYGSKIVHCRVCNVYTNSAKQLAEHLGGIRHKNLCFKFNVPITSLEVTSKDTHTLEDTKLVGMKLRCKYCQVELNSMYQYEEHMKSKNHKLRMEGKVLNPEKKMKKASKKFYKKWSKDDKKDDNEDAEKEKPSSDKADADADKAEEVDPKKAKMRQKYELDMLDDLHNMPSARNEMKFSRRNKVKKPPKLKPVPYMCDICQEFMKSAFELNEHLNSDDHKTNMRNFISGKKQAAENACNDNSASGSTDEKNLSKKPELYCEVCQLMLESEKMLKEHRDSKKHKFLAELKKGSRAESRTENVQAAAPKVKPYCDVCQIELESEGMMSEHVKSKKHKFLVELKPSGGRSEQPGSGPAPAAPGARHSRWEPAQQGAAPFQPQQRVKRMPEEDWDGDPRPHKRRQQRPEGREELPLLAALALERKELQAELAKRKREIEEQRALVEELRRRHEEEEEKMVLKRMIDECRQLLEERQRREARQEAARGHARRESSDRGTGSWNHSPPRDVEEGYDGGRSGPRGAAGGEFGGFETDARHQGRARKALLPRPDDWEGSRGSPVDRVGSRSRSGDRGGWGGSRSGAGDVSFLEGPPQVPFGDKAGGFRDAYDDRTAIENNYFGGGSRVWNEREPVRETYFGNSDEGASSRGGYSEEDERFRVGGKRGGGYSPPRHGGPDRGFQEVSGGARMSISTVPLRFGSCRPSSRSEQLLEAPPENHPERRILEKNPVFGTESRFSDAAQPVGPVHYLEPPASASDGLFRHGEERSTDASRYSSWSNENSIPLLDTPVAFPEKARSRDFDSVGRNAPADWQGERAAPAWGRGESTGYPERPYGTDLHDRGRGPAPGGPRSPWRDGGSPVPETRSLWGVNPPRIPGLDFV
ncbi:unnamed protein product [Ixodes persulcatus]